MLGHTRKCSLTQQEKILIHHDRFYVFVDILRAQSNVTSGCQCMSICAWLLCLLCYCCQNHCICIRLPCAYICICFKIIYMCPYGLSACWWFHWSMHWECMPHVHQHGVSMIISSQYWVTEKGCISGSFVERYILFRAAFHMYVNFCSRANTIFHLWLLCLMHLSLYTVVCIFDLTNLHCNIQLCKCQLCEPKFNSFHKLIRWHSSYPKGLGKIQYDRRLYLYPPMHNPVGSYNLKHKWLLIWYNYIPSHLTPASPEWSQLLETRKIGALLQASSLFSLPVHCTSSSTICPPPWPK